MTEGHHTDLVRRLEELAPVFGDLGRRTLATYTDAGILAALPDESFPISDAVFTRKPGRYVYHPHGPVYLYVTREGELRFADQAAGVTLAQALARYVQLAGPHGLADAPVVEGATEWFPPPRFLLDAETSVLHIASVSGQGQEHSHPGFMPFDAYVEERAGLFVEAYRNAR